VSELFFWVVVGVVALTEGLIVFTVLRARMDTLATGGLVGSRKAEVVWTLLPVLILIAIAVLSFQALEDAG